MTLLRGSVVDRYVVLDVIGAGSMGVVYAAYDPELDRKIALKIIGPQASVPASANADRDLLARAAQAMAQISDPNLVTVYDAGAFGSEVFIVMELIDGVSARRWLSERSVSFGEMLEVFLAAGKGLAAVHRAGLVHRDFKLDNILIAKDGRVRVTDIGLARANETADARSDQLSFCAALFEAIYGERPIQAGGVPSAPSPRGSARILPILRRGLRANPLERYPDMEALLAALARDPLRRWLRAGALALVMMLVAGLSLAIGLRLSARGPDCGRVGAALTDIWDPTRREAIHRAFSSIDIPEKEGIWSRVASGLDEYTQEWLSQRRATCEAARVGSSDERIALRNRCLDRRLAALRALSDLFAQATPKMLEYATQAVIELPLLRDCDGIEQAKRAHSKAAEGANLDASRLSAKLAKVRMLSATGLHKDALALAQQVAQEAEEQQSWFLAEALFYVGSIRLNGGEMKEDVAEVLRRAVLVAERNGDDETGVRARGKLVFLMGLLRSPMQRMLGHRYADEAAALLKRLGGAPRLELDLTISLSSLLGSEQQHEEAMSQLRRALTLLDSLPESERPDKERVAILSNLAATCGQLHRFDEAFAYAKEALSTREAAYGREDAGNISPLHNVSVALYAMGRHREAQAYSERALTLYRGAVGTESRREVYLLTTLADTLEAQGEHQRARSLYDESLAIAERVLDRTDPVWKEPLLGLGKVYVSLHQPQLAIPYLERALSTTATVLTPVERAELQLGLARALAAAGRDKRRVDELATGARTAYAAAKWERELAEVDAFLDGRGKTKEPR